MPFHLETDIKRSQQLSDLWGDDVFLKMDYQQPSGSFKIRGVCFLIDRHWSHV